MSPLILRLNGLLKREAEALGDVYVDIAPEDFTSDDFIDHGHFTPAGSLKFAAQTGAGRRCVMPIREQFQHRQIALASVTFLGIYITFQGMIRRVP